MINNLKYGIETIKGKNTPFKKTNFKKNKI